MLNKTFSQYVGVPLIEDIKLQTLSYEMKCCTLALKLVNNIPAFRLFDVMFLMAVLIWSFNKIFCITERAKK